MAWGDTPHGPIAELPIADLFGAAEGEDVGIAVLIDLAEQLERRQRREWNIFKLLPDETRWVGTTLSYLDEGPSDWVELDVSIRSWTTPALRKPGITQRLWRVWTSLDVPCECEPDHGIHRVQEVFHEAGSIDGLAEACASALDTTDGWLRDGALPADKWRLRAGLPTRGT